MTQIRSLAKYRTTRLHSTTREGVRLGLIVGLVTWLWLAGFDYAMGRPFHTVQFLGGFAGFTLIHFTLCTGYGVAIISAIHASASEPTIMFALIFSTILFQAAFFALTLLLENIGLGSGAWGSIFLGNVLAAGVTYVLIARDHPIRQLYHNAEAHQKD
jgi:hypothetical protein